MKRNVANWDRVLRLCAGLALFLCSIFAPFPLLVRVFAFGVLGCYMFLTALLGSCACYALFGRSTTPPTV
jgi:hypothetical protein